MNKDLQEYAQKAFKIGQISGKSFVVKRYLENARDCLLIGDDTNAKGYIEDALVSIKQIAKLSREI